MTEQLRLAIRNFLYPMIETEVRKELDLSRERGDTVRAGYIQDYLDTEEEFASDCNAEPPNFPAFHTIRITEAVAILRCLTIEETTRDLLKKTAWEIDGAMLNDDVEAFVKAKRIVRRVRDGLEKVADMNLRTALSGVLTLLAP